MILFYLTHIFFCNLIFSHCRKKISENSLVILKAKVSELKGRKLFMTATMEDVEGNILADSNSLFIIIKDAPEGASVFPPRK